MRLNDKERFFNRRLAYALILAGALHMAGFGLFRLSHQAEDQKVATNSAQVQVQLSQAEMEKLKGRALSTEVPLHLTAPKISLPLLPSMPLAQTDHHLAPRYVPLDSSALFASLHQKQMVPEELHMHFIKRHMPVQLALKGSLSSAALMDDGRGRLGASQPRFEPLLRHMATYHVKLHHPTGELFFVQLSQSSEDGELDRLGRSICQNMRFHPRNAPLIMDGVVEIYFEIGHGNSSDSLSKLYSGGSSLEVAFEGGLSEEKLKQALRQ